MNPNAPIGMFDSGVGGLSVMNEIRQLLPSENILYYADSLYCPYGSKDPEFIRQRSIKIANFLAEQGAKLIVIASNTTSTAGLEDLRKILKLPIVGLEPAVKPAAELSKKGRVGVLATGVTLASNRFSSLMDRYGRGIDVITVPCPGLVELVEAGRLSEPETEELLTRYMNPLLEQEVDTIVLGCTHYPFLRPLAEALSGPQVKVVDSGAAVARQVQRILEQENHLADKTRIGEETFYTSGDSEQVARTIELLLNKSPIQVESCTL